MTLIDKYPQLKALILDMDGVLWRDTHQIGNLNANFKRIEQLGLKVVLATNNASKNSSEYITKLAGFGVSLNEQQIVTSSMATGLYLQEIFPEKGAIYVVGSPSLKATMAGYGFKILKDASGEDAIAVIAGMDHEINYSKLANGVLLIRRGAAFIGTNPDATYPTPEGLKPGAGAIISFLETASGRKAEIIGKPKPELFKMSMNLMGVDSDETLAVGDRLETDIAGAQAVGCLSGLVLSGATSLAEAQDWKPQPDIIADDLASLLFT